jgi:hypothetical protein
MQKTSKATPGGRSDQKSVRGGLPHLTRPPRSTRPIVIWYGEELTEECYSP